VDSMLDRQDKRHRQGGRDLPSGKGKLAGTTPMRFDIGILDKLLAGPYDMLKLAGTGALTAWDMSLQVLLAREALAAICAKDHGDNEAWLYLELAMST